MALRYLLADLPPQGPFRLRGEVAHHLSRVLRARPGDEVVLGDGRGLYCRARVQGHQGGELDLEVGPHETAPPAAVEVHLAFAPPRWTRAEWLFEHGTEVGVQVFHPLWTERTRGQAGRTERWRKLCAAAWGQCDRAWVPDVREPRLLAEFLSDPALPTEGYLADPTGPPQGPAAGPAALLLVGPEGGFSTAERQTALDRGLQPRSLGPHVLRTETAALLGAALLYGIGKHASSAKLK